MKVIHFGDLHIWRKQMVWNEALNPKRWLGPVNLLLRRAKRFPPEYREPILRGILEADADLVVFSGDFTTLSLEDEYKEAAERFAPLVEHYGDRLFAIPGNHDRYTPGSEKKEFIRRYLPFADVDQVKRRDLQDGWSIVGVDHAEPFKIRSNGIVRDRTHEALRTQLTALQGEGRKAIVVGHFPCVSPPEHPESWDHGLIGEERLRDVLGEFEVPLYLHGHTHIRWGLQSAALPNTLCLNSGAAGMKSSNPEKQAGYLEFDFTEKGVVTDLKAISMNDETKALESRPLALRKI